MRKKNSLPACGMTDWNVAILLGVLLSIVTRESP